MRVVVKREMEGDARRIGENNNINGSSKKTTCSKFDG
jgi:hypothetical protein